MARGFRKTELRKSRYHTDVEKANSEKRTRRRAMYITVRLFTRVEGKL